MVEIVLSGLRGVFPWRYSGSFRDQMFVWCGVQVCNFFKAHKGKVLSPPTIALDVPLGFVCVGNPSELENYRKGCHGSVPARTWICQPCMTLYFHREIVTCMRLVLHRPPHLAALFLGENTSTEWTKMMNWPKYISRQNKNIGANWVRSSLFGWRNRNSLEKKKKKLSFLWAYSLLTDFVPVTAERPLGIALPLSSSSFLSQKDPLEKDTGAWPATTEKTPLMLMFPCFQNHTAENRTPWVLFLMRGMDAFDPDLPCTQPKQMDKDKEKGVLNPRQHEIRLIIRILRLRGWKRSSLMQSLWHCRSHWCAWAHVPPPHRLHCLRRNHAVSRKRNREDVGQHQRRLIEVKDVFGKTGLWEALGNQWREHLWETRMWMSNDLLPKCWATFGWKTLHRGSKRHESCIWLKSNTGMEPLSLVGKSQILWVKETAKILVSNNGAFLVPLDLELAVLWQLSPKRTVRWMIFFFFFLIDWEIFEVCKQKCRIICIKIQFSGRSCCQEFIETLSV